MKKSIFTFMLLIMFVTTACGNESVNEGEREEEKQNQVEEKPVKEEVTESEGNNEENKDEQPVEETKEIIMEKAEVILKLLEEKNTEEISTFVHPEKGVLFSPYLYVNTDAITFDKEKIKGFFEITESYTWGAYDGSGDPIELSPSEYYSKFIYDGEYQQADEIVFDGIETRGNSLRNVSDIFPDSHTIEYFIKGTEEYGNMDWKALNLVFEQDEQGEWKLVAIVHDQWTI
jgi:hypothetical protein